MSLIIMKNNVNIVQIYATADDADSSSAMVHTHLNLGDHVWVENAGGPGIHLHPGTFNYFSGILEKADWLEAHICSMWNKIIIYFKTHPISCKVHAEPVAQLVSDSLYLIYGEM